LAPIVLVINILVQNFAITSFLSYFSYFFKKQIQKQQKIKNKKKIQKQYIFNVFVLFWHFECLFKINKIKNLTFDAFGF
jgi:hypothetical protein